VPKSDFGYAEDGDRKRDKKKKVEKSLENINKKT